MLWSLLYIQSAFSAAFLEDALPLNLVSITPSQGNPTKLSGKDALTVVFSRPVIALGSDFAPMNSSTQGGLNLDQSMIPFYLVDLTTGQNLQVSGKTRWVTTYIARFDNDNTWATDLSFKVVVNPNLRTYDGVPIKLPAPQANFTTSPLTICVSGVQSPKASNATNGQWQPYINGNTNPEVPDDGQIQLQFSYNVMPSLLGKSLKLRSQTDNSSVAFTLGQCQQSTVNILSMAKTSVATTTTTSGSGVASTPSTQESAITCVTVMPKNLVHNAAYQLYIPRGTKYHPFAGPLTSEVKASFTGLLPFNFLVQNLQWSSFTHTQYDLALRHGLAAGTSLDTVKQQLSLTQGSTQVPFTVTLNNVANLRITAAFQASKQYTLTIRGSQDGATAVKDVFGQVMQSQVIQWTTGATPSYMVSADGYLVFEKSQFTATQWSLLVRGDPSGNSQTSFSLSPLPLTSLSQGLSYLDYSNSPYPGATTVPIGNDPSFKVVTLSLPTTPLFMRFTSSWSSSYSGSMTSITDLALATLTDYDGLLVWVTRMSNGQNVAGAQVKVFQYTYSYSANKPASPLITSGTTDANGLVRLNVGNVSNSASMRVLASYNGDATMVLDVSQSTISLPDVTTKVVTDRAVYQPGDQVHIKVYARSQAPNFAWALPKSGQYTLSAVWKPANSGGSSNTALRSDSPITWTGSWGTWSTTLTIPSDATYGDKTLSVTYKTGTGALRTVGSSPLTIANPRRPTATMTLTSDATLYRIYTDQRATNIPITATVLTGTGDPITGAGVSVKWQLAGPQNTTSGVIVITTGSDGNADYNFDISQELTNSAQYPAVPAGSTLTLTATYVGPTGELLTDDLSVPVDFTAWTLTVTPSIDTPLPGWSFGVYVDVTGQNGVEVANQAVTVNLQQLDDKLNAVGGPLNSCQATSGNSLIQCLGTPFRMPAIGKYQLVATVTDDKGYTLTQTQVLGQTTAEWNNNPLNQFSNVEFHMDKSSYKLGDTAKLVFWNPFPHATLLVRYGNRGGKTQFLVNNVAQGQNSVNIAVNATLCTKGCSLAAILSVSRSQKSDFTSAFLLPVGLPISLLFDPLAPRTFTTTGLQIPVTDSSQDLFVALNLATTKAEPGTSVDLNIAVYAADKKTRVQSEVAIFVVDQAFLDLQPYPLVPVASGFSIDRSESFQSQASTDNLATYQGYAATITTFQRRTAIDPWIYPNWQTSDPWSEADIDMTDAQYLQQYSSTLSTFGTSGYCPSTSSNYGSSGGGLMMLSSRAVPMAASAPVEMMARATTANYAADTVAPAPAPPQATQSASSVSPTIPVRSAMETTPLFVGSLVVSSTQAGKVTINLPGNIGKFSIRAYAVDSNSHFGGNETFLIAEKPLNLQALLPRIARTGDQFECGVTVAGGDESFDSDVTVTVQAMDQGLELDNTQSQVVRVQGTTPVQVRFGMSSVVLGTSSLRFTAQAATGASGELVQDGLQDSIPILALQDSVYVATSMAITAGSSTPWTEGIAFPPAVPGSGNLSLSAGVGRYPAIVSLSAVLLTPTDPTKTDSQLLISRVLTNALIKAYKPSSPSGTVTTLSGMITQAQQLLTQYTDATYGLRWSDRYTIQPSDPVDLSLNAYALYANIRAGNALQSSLTSQWTKALGAGVVAQVQQAITHGWNWTDYETLADIFLALGPQWVPDASASSQVKQILSLSNLLAQFDQLDIGGKATVALIHLIHGNVPHGWQYVSAAIQDILSYTRVQGRTAYVTTTAGGASAASTPVLSNCLSVLALNHSTHPFVEKIANYVGQGNSVNRGCLYSFSSQSAALAALALSDYDAARGTTKPNIAFKVVAASTPILQAVFTASTTPVAELDETWTSLPTVKSTGVNGDITTGPAPLSFVAAGTGEVSVAAGLTFVPAQLSTDPIYRGIYVEKIIQGTDAVSGDAIGNPIQAASFGQIVQVTVQITTPDDLWQVNLVDLVPGGLEPIDPNLANAQGVSPAPAPARVTMLTGVGVRGVSMPLTLSPAARPFMISPWVWYDPFANPQVMTDRVVWFANYLRAGTYSVTYKAVAVTPGTWQLPPAKADVASQPEVMGLSAAGVLLVSATPLTPDAIARADLPSQENFTPKECPTACTSSQFCNLRTGVCQTTGVSLQTSSSPVQACAVLRNVNVTWPDANTVRLSWTAPSAHDCTTVRYRIEYRAATDATWYMPKGQAITSTVVRITGLDQTRAWRFRITPLESSASSS